MKNLRMRRVELNQNGFDRIGYIVYNGDIYKEGDPVDEGLVKGFFIRKKDGVFIIHESYGSFNYGKILRLANKEDEAEKIAHEIAKRELDALVNEDSTSKSPIEEFAAA